MRKVGVVHQVWLRFTALSTEFAFELLLSGNLRAESTDYRGTAKKWSCSTLFLLLRTGRFSPAHRGTSKTWFAAKTMRLFRVPFSGQGGCSNDQFLCTHNRRLWGGLFKYVPHFLLTLSEFCHFRLYQRTMHYRTQDASVVVATVLIRVSFVSPGKCPWSCRAIDRHFQPKWKLQWS